MCRLLSVGAVAKGWRLFSLTIGMARLFQSGLTLTSKQLCAHYFRALRLPLSYHFALRGGAEGPCGFDDRRDDVDQRVPEVLVGVLINLPRQLHDFPELLIAPVRPRRRGFLPFVNPPRLPRV